MLKDIFKLSHLNKKLKRDHERKGISFRMTVNYLWVYNRVKFLSVARIKSKPILS
jgi:hypothetical protein